MDKELVIPLFATPIYLNKIKTDDFAEYIKTVEMERANSDNGWLSVDRNILENDSNLIELKNRINDHINKYVYDVCEIPNKNGQPKITTSWVVKNDPEDFGHPHHHRNSLFSGCLYFDIPPNSGDFILHKDPNHMNYMPTTVEFDYDNWNIFNTQIWKIKVEEGLIVLFPSHIRHSIGTNESDKPRYSFAFNVWWDGIIGDKESRLKL